MPSAGPSQCSRRFRARGLADLSRGQAQPANPGRPPAVSGEQWSHAKRAHFDFVVCDAGTYIPDFAVELDDASHRRPDAGGVTE
ncbi:MAG TPA: DUF2726 domain-containing protein [Trebonia sp.]|nr:DUF2726 domain-containing protein [Trebonia sp.]